MIVYGSRTAEVDLESFLNTFRRRLDALPHVPDIGTLVDCFVDFGEVESAAADALQPDEDDVPQELKAWTATADALARGICGSLAHDANGIARSIDDARASAAALETGLPQPIVAKRPEGFAQYGLLPEQYAAAAIEACDRLAPVRLECIGIRSVGLPLAHVVAAAASRRGVPSIVRSVRPRGHPFEREVRLGTRLRAKLAASTADVFAVVDEGPGLSGSSFAAAAEALAGCGIDSARIVFFPSWNAPEYALRSARGRAAWQSHRKFLVSFEEAASDLLRTFAPGRVLDLSAGKWRDQLLTATERWPPVQPQHERRKYVTFEGLRAHMFRFAGLGRHGAATLRRAGVLADGGFGVEPVGLSRGFLQLRWAPGVCLTGRPAVTAALLDRLASYLSFLKRTFGTGEPDDVDELRHMIQVNVGEDAGVPPATVPLPGAGFGPGERIALDGRMLPHEWIVSDHRLVKVDALDHHADDFFPGCRDIAWDVAAAVVEFELNGDAEARLVERYVRESRDASIRARLAFYRVAYAAWRLGYAAVAAETLGDSPDGRRFRADRARYRRSAG